MNILSTLVVYSGAHRKRLGINNCLDLVIYGALAVRLALPDTLDGKMR